MRGVQVIFLPSIGQMVKIQKMEYLQEKIAQLLAVVLFAYSETVSSY